VPFKTGRALTVIWSKRAVTMIWSLALMGHKVLNSGKNMDRFPMHNIFHTYTTERLTVGRGKIKEKQKIRISLCVAQLVLTHVTYQKKNLY